MAQEPCIPYRSIIFSAKGRRGKRTRVSSIRRDEGRKQRGREWAHCRRWSRTFLRGAAIEEEGGMKGQRRRGSEGERISEERRVKLTIPQTRSPSFQIPVEHFMTVLKTRKDEEESALIFLERRGRRRKEKELTQPCPFRERSPSSSS